MPLPGRHLFSALALSAAALGASLAGAAPAQAYSQVMQQPKYAAIVVDANTGEVLYQRKAGETRFPASITKVMTLYLTFEALATGRLHMDDPVPFSTWASHQAPSKLGVPAGDSITVRQAILGLTVKSANDAAVALAEKVGGTEAHFAQLMTLRAQELGMSGTRYVNANGLPDNRQVSNARDIAILARAVMRDYPQYYSFFDQPSMTWQGHFVGNPHSFLKKIPNVDGLKTGFTNAAGHNLVASAMRGGRRLVAVVLGASSTAARDENVADLMDAGFTVLDRRAHGQQINVASLMDTPNDAIGPLSRPLTEMGSAQDPQIAMVARTVPAAAAAYAPVRAATSKGRRAEPARAEPSRVAVTDDCRHDRGRALRRCRAAFHHAERNGTLVASADPCARKHGRQARACQRSEAVEIAAGARDACAGKHGRQARTCHATAQKAARTEVAAARSTCAARHGRHAHACRSEATQVAKAEHHPGRERHRTPQVATTASSRRHRHADVADTTSRHGKVKLEKTRVAVSSACREHPHARACRAYDEA